VANNTTDVSKTNPDSSTTVETSSSPRILSMKRPPLPRGPGAAKIGVVKNPSRNLTDISSLVPQTDAEDIVRLLFEQFSGIELSQILTPRTISGISQQYLIISNLSEIRRRYDPTRKLTVMDKLEPIFGTFQIDLDLKIPGEDYILLNNLKNTYSYLDENYEKVTVEKGYIYIDNNGDLIIELDNMEDDEIMQIQIDSNGTIYEVNNE